MVELERLYTIKEACEYLKISRATFYRLDLKTVGVGARSIRVRESALLAQVSGTEPAPTLAPRAMARRHGALSARAAAPPLLR